MLVGYPRDSTGAQKLEGQHDALTGAGVRPDHLSEHKTSEVGLKGTVKAVKAVKGDCP